MTGPRALSFRNDPTLVVVVGLLAAVFWLLRIYYWSITVEEPFSDMTDYIETARQIKTHFFFGLREGLYAYYNPVTPSLLAISMILGGDSFLWVFRVLVQLIAFIATLLLAYEIAILTGRRWLGIALLAAVALCRPSIFWSLKPSTETPSEALLLASIGLGLHAYRTRSLSAAAACGLMCIFLSLNRSQFLPSALIVGAIFLYSTLFRRGEKTWDMQTAVSSRRWFARVRLNLDSTRLAQTICFALGLAVVWTPWI